jgi:hypothetical protein
MSVFFSLLHHLVLQQEDVFDAAAKPCIEYVAVFVRFVVALCITSQLIYNMTIIIVTWSYTNA